MDKGSRQAPGRRAVGAHLTILVLLLLSVVLAAAIDATSVVG
ncbi:MAG TPA: hypothetical protein VFG35_25100 [Actinoplanes sp.]|nr:hypothetical protein [Actinoplanes sp.]